MSILIEPCTLTAQEILERYKAHSVPPGTNIYPLEEIERISHKATDVDAINLCYFLGIPKNLPERKSHIPNHIPYEDPRMGPASMKNYIRSLNKIERSVRAIHGGEMETLTDIVLQLSTSPINSTPIIIHTSLSPASLTLATRKQNLRSYPIDNGPLCVLAASTFTREDIAQRMITLAQEQKLRVLSIVDDAPQPLRASLGLALYIGTELGQEKESLMAHNKILLSDLSGQIYPIASPAVINFGLGLERAARQHDKSLERLASNLLDKTIQELDSSRDNKEHR